MVSQLSSAHQVQKVSDHCQGCLENKFIRGSCALDAWKKLCSLGELKRLNFLERAPSLISTVTDITNLEDFLNTINCEFYHFLNNFPKFKLATSQTKYNAIYILHMKDLLMQLEQISNRQTRSTRKTTGEGLKVSIMFFSSVSSLISTITHYSSMVPMSILMSTMCIMAHIFRIDSLPLTDRAPHEEEITIFCQKQDELMKHSLDRFLEIQRLLCNTFNHLKSLQGVKEFGLSSTSATIPWNLEESSALTINNRGSTSAIFHIKQKAPGVEHVLGGIPNRYACEEIGVYHCLNFVTDGRDRFICPMPLITFEEGSTERQTLKIPDGDGFSLSCKAAQINSYWAIFSKSTLKTPKSLLFDDEVRFRFICEGEEIISKALDIKETSKQLHDSFGLHDIREYRELSFLLKNISKIEKIENQISSGSKEQITCKEDDLLGKKLEYKKRFRSLLSNLTIKDANLKCIDILKSNYKKPNQLDEIYKLETLLEGIDLKILFDKLEVTSESSDFPDKEREIVSLIKNIAEHEGDFTAFIKNIVSIFEAYITRTLGETPTFLSKLDINLNENKKKWLVQDVSDFSVQDRYSIIQILEDNKYILSINPEEALRMTWILVAIKRLITDLDGQIDEYIKDRSKIEHPSKLHPVLCHSYDFYIPTHVIHEEWLKMINCWRVSLEQIDNRTVDQESLLEEILSVFEDSDLEVPEPPPTEEPYLEAPQPPPTEEPYLEAPQPPPTEEPDLEAPQPPPTEEPDLEAPQPPPQAFEYQDITKPTTSKKILDKISPKFDSSTRTAKQKKNIKKVVPREKKTL